MRECFGYSELGDGYDLATIEYEQKRRDGGMAVEALPVSESPESSRPLGAARATFVRQAKERRSEALADGRW